MIVNRYEDREAKEAVQEVTQGEVQLEDGGARPQGREPYLTKQYFYCTWHLRRLFITLVQRFNSLVLRLSYLVFDPAVNGSCEGEEVTTAAEDDDQDNIEEQEKSCQGVFEDLWLAGISVI